MSFFYRLLNFSSSLEHLSRHLQTQRKLFAMDDILRKVLDAVHSHSPVKFSGWLCFIWRSVEGRVIEGKISLIFYELLNGRKTERCLIIRESAHQNKVFLSIFSKQLTNSVNYVFWPMIQSRFVWIFSQKDEINFGSFFKKFLEFFCCLIISL